MSNDPRSTSAGSWALQGCLFGAVALFIVLLLIMVFLAYRRFQENTEPSPAAAVAVWTASERIPTDA